MNRERWMILVAWLVSVVLLAGYFELVLPQIDTTPPSAPYNVQVIPANLQVTTTGDTVTVKWNQGNCTKVTSWRSSNTTTKVSTIGVKCVGPTLTKHIPKRKVLPPPK